MTTDLNGLLPDLRIILDDLLIFGAFDRKGAGQALTRLNALLDRLEKLDMDMHIDEMENTFDGQAMLRECLDILQTITTRKDG